MTIAAPRLRGCPRRGRQPAAGKAPAWGRDGSRPECGFGGEEAVVTNTQTTAWPAVLIAVLAGVLAAMHVGKLPPALPMMRAELGFGLVAGGFVVALFSVLGMTLAVFVGGTVARLGRERVVLIGFACLAAGGALGALAQGVPMLMFSRLVEGVGFIAVAVSLPSVILAAAAPRDHALALGLWSVYMPLGMAMVMLAAPLILETLGWRMLWWGVFALCPLIALALMQQMRALSPAPAPRTDALCVAREAMRAPGLILVALIFGVYAMQWVTLMVWLPTFQTESLGVSLDRAALVTALVVLINVPGCLFGGWLMRRGASARGLVITGSIIMGLCSLGIFLPLLPDAARIAVAVAFSFFGGLVPPSLFNSVPPAAPTPSHVGAGNGLLMQGSSVGQFVGPPLVAWAVTLAAGDWRLAAVPMLAACLTAIAAAVFLGRWHS